MDKKELKTKLKEVMSLNENLRERVESENWMISYNKKADMLLMGGVFPEGSFYLPIEDGVMLRVDENNKVWGFAIENTKHFIRNNPEVGFILSFIVYPVRTRIAAHLSFLIGKIGEMAKEKQIEAVAGYVTSRVTFA